MTRVIKFVRLKYMKIAKWNIKLFYMLLSSFDSIHKAIYLLIIALVLEEFVRKDQ